MEKSHGYLTITTLKQYGLFDVGGHFLLNKVHSSSPPAISPIIAPHRLHDVKIQSNFAEKLTTKTLKVMSELNNNEMPNVCVENPTVVNNPVSEPEVKQEPVVAQPTPQPAPQPVQPAQPAQAAPQTNQMVFTKDAKQAIREMCSWVKIVAVFELITLILSMAGPILMPLVIGGAAGRSGIGMMAAIPAVIISLIMLIPLVRLFKFCSRAKKALKGNDSKMMEQAMKAMSSFWSFCAVIIMLAVVAGLIAFFAMGGSFLGALFS